MREAARPVEKMMNKRMKQQPVQVEAHRTGGGVEKNKQAARTENTQGEKIMQAAGEADEPEEAMREAARPVEKMMNKRMKQQPVQVEAHRTGGGVEKNKQAARKNTLELKMLRVRKL